MNRRAAILTFLFSLFSFIFSSKAANMPKNTQVQFALKFFFDLVNDLPSGNIIISPSSVYLALSLLYNGAKGLTQKEMSQLLETQDLELETLNQDNLELQTILSNPDSKVTLSIANSLWVKSGVYIYPSFIESLQYFYKAEITNLDFTDPKSVIIINDWVKKKTNDKITSIIDQISSEEVLFLINAIYFKGLWAQPFDKNLTQNKPFYQLNGSTKEVPLMRREGEYSYLENDLFQAVSLPYSDQKLSLDIFLPQKTINFKTFLAQFNLEKWQQWLPKLRERKGTVEIPRFKLEYQITLNSILQKLGMNKAFQANQADFSGLTNIPVHVSDVIHKTYLEVNEEGTEAAAVTSIGVRAMSIPLPTEPFIFTADRPFVCVLREHKTGSLLFMATIVNPS